MLGKTIKYNFKAVGRFLLPLYAVLILSGLATKLAVVLSNIDSVSGSVIFSILSAILTLLYSFSAFVAIAGTMVVLVIHYYKSFTGDEAYFTFTLPVSYDTQLLGKLLNGAIWIVFSLIVFFATLAVFFIGNAELPELLAAFKELFVMISRFVIGSGSGASTVAMSICFVIIALFSGQMTFYVCITMGQLLKNHRILGAFAAYAVLGVINQIVSFAFNVNGFFRIRNIINDELGAEWFFGMMWRSIIQSLVFLALEYFLSRIILKKALNVE